MKHGVADNEAKPNTAVQVQSRFISENKAVMIMGSVSSAVAVALNKLADREKVIYLPIISGSNDTTGKDCARYSFRECFYAETAANGLAPVLIKNIGKDKKVAYLTPDYTYGHTVHQSFEAVTKKDGWTTVTNQVCPLGAPDYSSYLLNIANSGADVFININFGNDAVQSIKQAQQFGIFDKQTLVVPYNTPFLAKQVGPDIMKGVYAATDFWWTLQDQYPLGQAIRRGVREEIRLQAGMGRQCRLPAGRDVGRCGGAGQDLLSAGGDQGLRGRAEGQLHGGRRLFPRRRPSVGSPGRHPARQGQERHEERRRLLRRPGRAAGRTA